ncbi:MAG: sulfur oxidation c-type cytochrome SoxA [Burkholderiaceae bacterium]
MTVFGAVLAQGADSDTRRSGFADMGRELQAMQRDDAQNPGLLWVADGAALWSRPVAGPTAQPSCASCHGDAARSMRGVAARYPAWDSQLGRPVDLAQRINGCRERRQHAPPFAPESQELLALESHVGHASRGLPIAPPDDARLLPYRLRGEALHKMRIGQLDLSCAQCHDERAGMRLAGSVIPQGRSVGYPIYRLEWQGLGSLQRRLRNCMTGVRAQPFDYGAPELVELELYLAWRDRGMGVETPGVRP